MKLLCSAWHHSSVISILCNRKLFLRHRGYNYSFITFVLHLVTLNIKRNERRRTTFRVVWLHLDIFPYSSCGVVMVVTQIRKRDGRTVPFDKNKVVDAIFKAAGSVGGKNYKLAVKLSDSVEEELGKKDEIPTVEDVQDAVEKVLIEDGHAKTAKAYILWRQKRAEIREAKALLGVTDEVKLSMNAIKVLASRYLRRDEKRKITESTGQMFSRVARAIADVEKLYGKDSEYIKKSEDDFYNAMTNLEFLPNSPTLMNAGTELGMLSACFVLPVEDDMNNIFDAVKNAALVHQGGGGTGFSFTRLRPKGDMVKSTGGVASGPISFMQVFNAATEVIKQGGKRRGANMGILRVDHPDILEFITCKEREGVLSNFNLSVAITDEFMKAVEKNGEYDLINPRTKESVKRLPARAIFNLLVMMSWKNGEPGIVFIDEINKHNPTPKLGKIESTNPCLSADTLIFTNHSVHPLGELVKYESELEVLADLRCEGKEGSLFVDGRAIHTGRKKLYRVRLKNGMFIDATEDHRILTDHGFVEVKELKSNDKVCIHIEDILPTHPNDTDKNIAQLLGWLIGDGWVYCDTRYSTNYKHYGFVFSKDDFVALNIIKQVLKQSDIPFKERANKGCTEIFCCGNKPMEFFDKFGISFDKEKSVPLTILNGGRDSVIGFLQGLFSADGYVSKPYKNRRRIVLTSVSPRLLHQVQILLAALGIHSSVKKGSISDGVPYGKGKISKARQRYDLYITASSFFSFVDKIGFPLSPKKCKGAENIVRLTKDLKFAKSIPKWSKLISIHSLDVKDVYDIKEPIIHSFIANGIVVHNCGEQPLLPYESCNLGSINLTKMIKDGEGKAEIDWDKLRSTVRLAVRFLDNVIDANKYPIKEIEVMTKANRKIGLGVMGFADFLIQLGISYSSEEGVKTADEVMKFIDEESKKMSEELGAERGSFKNFQGSVWEKKYKAMRNATTTTIAPTGTIGVIANSSSGIEPIFAVSYIRSVSESLGHELIEVNSLFERIMIEEELYNEELMKNIAKRGSVQGVNEVPQKIKNIFVTALDIAPEWHVRMQAAFQKHVDNAVSKTINFSNYATPHDVEKAFMAAWRLKCKGLTVYRYGSRDVQVLNIENGKTPKPEKCEECVI